MSAENLEQTFRVPSPAVLEVSNIRGSVEVTAGEAGEIVVRAVKRPGSGDAEHTEIRMTQDEDGRVIVETRAPEGQPWFWHRKPCKVDYAIRAPRQCVLKVSGVSNSASLSGLEGELAISTVSGPLKLQDLAGSIKINTVSGSVHGERLAGGLVFETVSGNVHLEQSSFPSIRSSTVSGSVSLHSTMGEGPYRFDSVSGQVRWQVPGESACTVEASSLSGGLRTNLPKRTQSRETRRHGPGGKEVVELNGGGAPVSFHSVSGVFRLESWEGEGAAPGAPSQEAPGEAPGESPNEKEATLTRMEILDRIEQGEITAEEGAALMRR